jgi:hypothetical protein
MAFQETRYLVLIYIPGVNQLDVHLSAVRSLYPCTTPENDLVECRFYPLPPQYPQVPSEVLSVYILECNRFHHHIDCVQICIAPLE